MESRKATGKISQKRKSITETKSPKYRGASERPTQSFVRFEREIIRIFERTRFDEATASCSPKDEKKLEELVEEYAKSW